MIQPDTVETPNHPNLQSILCCPESRQPLTPAGAEVLATLNRAIRKGRVRNQGGETVVEALESALIRRDLRLLYPVRQGIPVLLVDAGIALETAPPTDSPTPLQTGG